MDKLEYNSHVRQFTISTPIKKSSIKSSISKTAKTRSSKSPDKISYNVIYRDLQTRKVGNKKINAISPSDATLKVKQSLMKSKTRPIMMRSFKNSTEDQQAKRYAQMINK